MSHPPPAHSPGPLSRKYARGGSASSPFARWVVRLYLCSCVGLFSVGCASPARPLKPTPIASPVTSPVTTTASLPGLPIDIPPQQPPPPPPKVSTLLFAGDIAFPQAADKRASWRSQWRDVDPSTHFDGTRTQIAAADFAIGNIEMVIADGRQKRARNLHYAFIGPSSLAHVLAEAGFDAMTAANNHVLDFGFPAFFQTLQHLSNANIQTFGAGQNLTDARRPLIIDLHGTRIAFLGYSILYRADYTATPNRPGVAPFKTYDRLAFKRAQKYNYETFTDDLQDLKPTEQALFIEDIYALKGSVDHIVLFFHWGSEKHTHAAPYQRAAAHMAIDAGASLVVGAGPHVVQEFEIYKGRFIEYSLGNHLFASRGTSEGVLLEVDVAGPRLIEARRFLLDANNTDDTPFNPLVVAPPTTHHPTD